MPEQIVQVTVVHKQCRNKMPEQIVQVTAVHKYCRNKSYKSLLPSLAISPEQLVQSLLPTHALQATSKEAVCSPLSPSIRLQVPGQPSLQIFLATAGRASKEAVCSFCSSLNPSLCRQVPLHSVMLLLQGISRKNFAAPKTIPHVCRVPCRYACRLQKRLCFPKFVPLNPQPSTLNPQPSTLNPQPSTRNPQPSTLNPQPSTLNPKPYPWRCSLGASA